MNHILKLLLMVAVLLPACGGGGDSGTSPSAPSFTGTWNGTAQDTQAGSGTFQVTFSQAGTSVTGTWQIAFPGTANGGSLTGTASGTSLQATLTPSDPTTCPFNLTGNLSGNTLSGNYAAFNCTGVVTGSFTATRQ